MKINELISDFKIFMSNEEREILGKLQEPSKISSFTEREQQVIENLIRKSLVIKVGDNNPTVIINEI